ncbi:DUF1648 domain-containing protein [Streptomyces altiplanensis]
MKQTTGRGSLAALTALPYVVALAAELILFTVVRDRLPDPLATHFDGTVPDRFTGQGAFVLMCIGLMAGTAALFVAGLLRGAFARWAVPVAYGTAGLLGAGVVSVVLVNAGATGDAAAARMPLWHLAVSAVVGAAAAGAGWLTVRTLRLPEGASLSAGGTARLLDLAEGEVAGWTRTASSRQFSALGLVTAAVGCVLVVPVGWQVAVPLFLAGLLVLCFSRLTVTAGPRGLTVSPALLPRPRVRVPLDAMTVAVSREIRPVADFGGWGYRLRPDATGVVLRSGEALVVRRGSGREFAVTVDDSATAAALLNSLISAVPATGPRARH